MSAQAATAPVAHPLEFDQLSRAHRPFIYRYAYRLCGHHHLAEDLVQDSLLRAWRSIDRLHSPAALLAWLKTIVRREQFWRVFEACLDHLPERTSRVFMMREFLELETDAICQELAITTANCWVILHRTRMGLRLCLEDTWFIR